MTMRPTLTLGAALVATLAVLLSPWRAARPHHSCTGEDQDRGFDSRIVALAYYNSEAQRAAMQQMTADLKAAKAAGDEAKIKHLQFQGPALQNLMHYQVFSTASIPNVMEKLAPTLPQIAQRTGVSLIVSKWEVSFQREDVERVDVTDELVRQFNPNEKVQKWIAEGAAKPPVPLLELVKTMRPDR